MGLGPGLKRGSAKRQEERKEEIEEEVDQNREREGRRDREAGEAEDGGWRRRERRAGPDGLPLNVNKLS